MKRVKKQMVFVAMSGGVDSSVAAALLLKQGYNVTGAFMKQWSENSPSNPSLIKGGRSVCTWKEDRRDALRVAAHLGIPLLTLDFEKEYKEWVMGYMFDEYEKGRTPNPDVLCNKWIKFGFWQIGRAHV
jgi:tRNA-specific 2-thiouridylase